MHTHIFNICMYIYIKTHSGELQGQEKAAYMHVFDHYSDLFTYTAVLKFANTVTKATIATIT